MATVRRSTNCAAYTDTLSVFVTATATVPGDEERCTVPLDPYFSCQTSTFERPDEATASLLRAEAEQKLEELECDSSAMDISFTTNHVGTRNVEYDANKLRDSGLVSNCFREGNNVNAATHRAEARCSPMFDMTDVDGNRVRNTNMTFLSNLSACDVSEEAMPQIQEDLRRVAAANAQDGGYTRDKPEHLACTFSILPQI